MAKTLYIYPWIDYHQFCNRGNDLINSQDIMENLHPGTIRKLLNCGIVVVNRNGNHYVEVMSFVNFKLIAEHIADIRQNPHRYFRHAKSIELHTDQLEKVIRNLKELHELEQKGR